jgi:hypothetical protein
MIPALLSSTFFDSGAADLFIDTMRQGADLARIGPASSQDLNVQDLARSASVL